MNWETPETRLFENGTVRFWGEARSCPDPRSEQFTQWALTQYPEPNEEFENTWVRAEEGN